MQKILECSSKGDKRFSAFYARVSVFGKTNTIENHYQFAKIYRLVDGSVHRINSISEIKGKTKRTDIAKLIGFEVNGKIFEPRYLTSFYQSLWIKYLDNNPLLVEFAKQFDDYHDIFKGKNTINCQADVIRQYIKKGRKSFFENEIFKEYIFALGLKHQVFYRRGNLFTGDMDIFGHQTNCLGYMGKGIAKEVKSLYPKVYYTYKDAYKNMGDRLLGSTLILNEHGDILGDSYNYSECKIIANIFGQNRISASKKMTQYDSFKTALIELKEFAKKYMFWIGIPSYIGCRNGGGNWEIVRGIIEEIFTDYPIILFEYDC